MQYSSPKDNFRLAYDRHGSGPAAVLLHGWPGDRTDYDKLVPQLSSGADVIVPDLRGFGQSDKHLVDPTGAYSPIGQADAIAALLDELNVKNAVLAGYDVGSLVAQIVASRRPDLVKALVVSPPLPGAGERVLELTPVKEFWYTTFHQQQLSLDIVDGNVKAVRAYLNHFWSHWSGPKYVVDEKRIDHLVEVYSPVGAFEASIGWYRSNGNPVTAYAEEKSPAADARLKTPTTVLWQEFDAIFPRAWSDRLDKFFTNYKLELLDGVGHFTPLEATDRFAAAIKERLKS